MSDLLPNWAKHHGSHALIACGVAFTAVSIGWPVWLGALLGCIGFPLIHEAIEVWQGSRSTADWRDHVADFISYQPAWCVLLIGAGAWGYAGLLLALIGVSYAATLRWSRPGPYQP